MKVHTIVKVQLPLATNEPEPMALFYTEGKKFMILLPIDKHLLKKMKDDNKAFFYADITDSIKVTLHGRAPWQDW
jgi:hypothetical protein